MKRYKSHRLESSRIDWSIILCVLILALIGIVSIYVAALHDTNHINVSREVTTQIIWYILGIILISLIIRFDAKKLWQLAPYFYGLGLFLLIAVLIFYSRSYYVQTGAKSWFSLRGFTFQPSEIMKPAYILMMARICVLHNRSYSHNNTNDWHLIEKLFMCTLPILVLLKLQNDFGTSLVFVAIFAGFLLISGINWRLLIKIFGITFIIGIVLLMLVATQWGRIILTHLGFQSYQFARVDAWLHPSANTSNQSYQIWQSIKAIGSGRLFGTGYNVSNVYVPVRESDMIFSVIGENFGFLGCTLLILLYFYLIYQMIHIVLNSNNIFYSYIAAGVIMMILFHVFENIGMNIGLLPLTGIPLPFVSQGGSSLIGNLIGVGLIMSMKYHYNN